MYHSMCENGTLFPRCQACLGDWPTYDGLKRSVARSGMSSRADEIKRTYAAITKATRDAYQVRS